MKKQIYKKKGGSTLPDNISPFSQPMKVDSYSSGSTSRMENNFNTNQNFDKKTQAINRSNAGHGGARKSKKKMYGGTSYANSSDAGNACDACQTPPGDIVIVQPPSLDGKQRNDSQSSNSNIRNVTSNRAKGICASCAPKGHGGDYCASNPNLCNTQQVEPTIQKPGFSLTSGGSKKKRKSKKRKSKKRKSKKRTQKK